MTGMCKVVLEGCAGEASPVPDLRPVQRSGMAQMVTAQETCSTPFSSSSSLLPTPVPQSQPATVLSNRERSATASNK